MKKIIFTGGGTVGHVTLNLLLIPHFIEAGWQVHYIGDKKGIEYQELKNSGLDVTFHGIATGKLRRYFSWQNMLDVFKVGWGIIQSLAIMLKVRPQALFSKGGFVSVPPVIAARVSGVPVYVHESDLSMGLANKIAYKFASKMYSTFEQAESLTKVEHVGGVTKVVNRDKVIDIKVAEIFSRLNSNLPTLLFVGGSGGARVFNDFITEHKERLTAQYNIINLTGDSSLNGWSKNLYRVDYITDLYIPLLKKADLVITRGGSNTLFELLALQKLHIIVPLGREASRGDQIENAAYFERKGYAMQLSEKELTLQGLLESVKEVLEDKASYLEAMKQSDELQTVDSFYDLLQTDIARKMSHDR